MIQRKQTLFLLFLVFSSIALIMVPCNYLVMDDGSTLSVSLFSLNNVPLSGSIWRYTGVALDIAALILALATIFLYKKRVLQVRLCFILMLLELGVTLIVSLCPVVIKTEHVVSIENSGLASIIGVIGMMGAYLAVRYIKKDIALLKSADRIR